MKEIWKDTLKGYYQVSNMGRVKRVRLWTGKVVGRWPKLYKTDDGYPRLSACVEGKYIYVSVHTLVAAAFIGPKPDGMEINHKNFIPDDVRAENLEYLTHLENVQYTNGAGRKATFPGENNGMAVLEVAQVREIRRSYFSGEWKQRELAEKFGVSQQTISFVINKGWKNVA